MDSQFREIIRQRIVDALAARPPALTRRDVRLPAVPGPAGTLSASTFRQPSTSPGKLPYTRRGIGCCRGMDMSEIVRSILERNLGDFRRFARVAYVAATSNLEPFP